MLPIRYLSVCSGIEAFSVAARGLPFVPVAFSEIEPFPCAVLAHHYPDVPNLGDMTKIDGRKYRGAVDLIVGGTPCQDFSVAGKRAGMAGERGSLALDYIYLVDAVSPRWVVWENVPGVLSSNGGKDFARFVRNLGECGYGWAYRVLDAQYFGVPQRRRRVFLVGYFGDWRPAAAVLFEPGSLRGDSAPRKKTRAHVTTALTESFGRGGADDNRVQGGFYVPEIVSQAMSCKWRKGTSGPSGDEHHNLIAMQENSTSVAVDIRNSGLMENGPTMALQAGGMGHGRGMCINALPHIISFNGTQDPDVSGNVTHPIGRNQGQECAVCLPINTQVWLRHKALGERTGLGIGKDGDPAYTLQRGHSHGVAYNETCLAFQPGNITMGAGSAPSKDIFPTLKADHGRGASDQQPHVVNAMQVRRLTPRECERLQGFPDDHTAIPFRGKPAADSPRYRALGNSMAVPVVRWIAERIAAHKFMPLEQPERIKVWEEIEQ